MTGRIQNEDIKTQAELVAAGGTPSQLPNDVKIWLTAYGLAKRFDAAILNYDFGDGDTPLRMFGSTTPDNLLHINSSQFKTIDGTTKSTGLISDVINAFAATTINFQTAAVTGGTITLYGGGSFALPTTTIGQFRRMALAFNFDGTLTANFSAAAASVGALASAASLFVPMSGIPIGWIDLEATGANAFRTAGSTGTLIENAVGGVSRIVRIPFSTGTGGGDTSFLAQSVAANVITLKGGYLWANLGGREIEVATYDGTSNGADISMNLKTEVNTEGVVAPGATQTGYYLYLDLVQLTALTTTAGGRTIYRAAKGTTGPFVIYQTAPAGVDLNRYIPLAVLTTDGSSNYVLDSASARRTFTAPLTDTVPVRIAANYPTPDSKLYFLASKVAAPDGAARVSPPVNDLVNTFVATTIDWQTNAIVGGTVNYNGAAFSIPASTAGRFRRFVFALQQDGSISVGYGSEQVLQASLENPGTLLSPIGGLPIGYVDLVATNTNTPGKYKTAGSATAVIENAPGGVFAVFRFLGGGGGGGSDRTYAVTTAAATSLSIKGGYLALDDERELSSGSGTSSLTAGADLTVNPQTILTQSGLVFAADTLYTLVIDLNTLPPTSLITLTGNKRQVYPWGETNLKFIVGSPFGINPQRYVYIDQIHTAVASTDFASADIIAKPTKVHDTLGLVFTQTLVSAKQVLANSNPQTVNHGLGALPQSVTATYYDGTNTYPIPADSVVTNVTTSQVIVNPGIYDCTGGKYITIYTWYNPSVQTVAGTSRNFESQWYSASGPSSLAHGLNDHNDIKGIAVQRYDVSAGRYSQLVDPNALVTGWDDTNLYLDWTTLVGPEAPSATLQYRIISGGSPLPWAIPLGYGGFTKFIGLGPGSYANLAAAKAAASPGDNFLVLGNTTDTADVNWNVADTRIRWAKGFTSVFSGAAVVNGFRMNAARVALECPKLQAAVTAALTTLLSVEGIDCEVERGYLENNSAGQTVTDLVKIQSGASRAYVKAVGITTAGTTTNVYTDADGGGDIYVRG